VETESLKQIEEATESLKQIEQAQRLRSSAPGSDVATAPAANVMTAPRPALRSPLRTTPAGPLALPTTSVERFDPIRQPWVFRRYKRILFLLIFVLPTCAATVYYCFLASPQYVTEFYLGIRTADASLTTLSAGGGTGGGGSSLMGGSTLGETIIGLESYVVTQFVTSREMADLLDKQIGLRKRFNDSNLDFWSKLDPKAQEEAFATYWQNMVYAYFDLTTGAIDVQVRAFTPKDSLDIANAVINNATKRISDMRDQARNDELRGARDELAATEQRVIKTRAALHEIRNRENIFDPQERVGAITTTADKLRDDIAGMEAEARALGTTMTPDSPAMTVLRNRIAASKAQLKQVEAEITNNDTDNGVLTAVVNRFNEANAEESFAETAYQGALQSLELARNTADREQLFLVNFVKPSLPQTSIYPDTGKSIATVAAFALVIWLMICILIQSIRDHAL
jgi:capsular polysaccharide transport system permease protein